MPDDHNASGTAGADLHGAFVTAATDREAELRKQGLLPDQIRRDLSGFVAGWQACADAHRSGSAPPDPGLDSLVAPVLADLIRSGEAVMEAHRKRRWLEMAAGAESVVGLIRQALAKRTGRSWI